jgi:type III HopA1-like effector protein
VSAFDDQLRAIVAAVELPSADRARVRGVLGETYEVPVANERGAFLGLAEALYAGHYSPMRGAFEASNLAPDAFLAQLYAANPIPPRYEDGWTVARYDPNGFVLVRGMQQRVAALAEIVPLGGGLAPGMPVRVPAQREALTAPYGHYVITGRAIHDAKTGRQVRFYWNVGPGGAATFLREIGARLERRRIPFQAKVPAHPQGYGRTDAGVLYLGDDDVQAARDAIGATYHALRSALRPQIPLFTREIAPGLAFGESPPTWDSFGMHRCDLIAEGLHRAFASGASGDDARLAAVRDRLIAYGFDLDRFERNPTSHYPYPLEGLVADAA